MQDELTTAALDVPGVEVIREKTGKAFAGPFYPDQLELLRATLRDMPRREKFAVVANAESFWIHRKP